MANLATVWGTPDSVHVHVHVHVMVEFHTHVHTVSILYTCNLYNAS